MNKRTRDVVSLTIVALAACFMVAVLSGVGEGRQGDTSRDWRESPPTREHSALKPESTGSGYPVDLQRWEDIEDANSSN